MRNFNRFNSQNTNRWLVSYADFITLLFAFFVFLFAISDVNEEKFQAYSNSLVKLFDTRPTSDLMVEKPFMPAGESVITSADYVEPLPDIVVDHPSSQAYPSPSTLLDLKQDVESEFSQKIYEKLFSVSGSESWLEFSLNSDLNFIPGTDQLTAAAESVLYELVKKLKSFDVLIKVEGHTDNTPLGVSEYTSNWDLSAARAVTVVEFLQQAGIDPGKMSIAAYGEYQPISDNNLEAGRALNRRVVIQASNLLR